MNLSELDKNPADVRVMVAMSGGVDSSVTAAVLKNQGYEVVGATLVLCEKIIGSERVSRYVDDARKVAARLGIEHHVFEYEDSFDELVIGSFVDSYLAGETPSPCARCNKFVKFGFLMEKARELGALALATGHYVRRVDGPKGAELHKASDPRRDQSYFLFLLSQDQLDFVRFPLGDMPSKDETRAIARKLGLEVAANPDSQDICFVPDGDYVSLIKRLRSGAIVPGNVVDLQGRVLGKHEGIVHFTVGQRRGINLSDRVGENNDALYVVRLDAKTNQVVVGPRSALVQKEVVLRAVNWLGDAVPDQGVVVDAKLRSAQKPVRATFRLEANGQGFLTLDEPVFAVAPGQAGVLYIGDRMMGGGWIARSV